MNITGRVISVILLQITNTSITAKGRKRKDSTGRDYCLDECQHEAKAYVRGIRSSCAIINILTITVYQVTIPIYRINSIYWKPPKKAYKQWTILKAAWA